MPIVIKKGRRYSTGICTSALICQACYSKINSNVLHGEFLSNIHSFSMNFYVTGLFNKILKLNVDFCIWEIKDKERCQKLHNWSNCAQIKINDPLFVPNDENFVFLVKRRVSYIWNSDKQTAMIPLLIATFWFWQFIWNVCRLPVYVLFRNIYYNHVLRCYFFYGHKKIMSNSYDEMVIIK